MAINAEIIAALNALLEEERATVDALVALVSMATDSGERQALTAMGGQAVQACIDLREHLERLEAPIGQRVSTSIGRILSPEHLDDRLRAFSALQLALAHRCDQLRETPDLDLETSSLLTRLRDVQQAHALWSERRADEFAASRPEPDPAMAALSGDASNPRGERPWSVPLPERRAHLTPRFAATPPAMPRDQRSSSDHNAPIPFAATPRPDESAPSPVATFDPRASRDTHRANGSVGLETAPNAAAAGQRPSEAASTGVDAATRTTADEAADALPAAAAAAADAPLPATTPTPQPPAESPYAAPPQVTAYEPSAALPEATALASDESPAPAAVAGTAPDAAPDSITQPPPKAGKPRAATSPRVPRTRATPAKAKPRPTA